ncbi:lysozyme [Sphingomonas parva]|uniref:Lysozyme n=1 Tax=Sphingomonas parva TaxID=2555898 RepID=A0A4Y8ZP38_9SPHN|nr:GH25 family lysozyme [Sphingomonas parva]TFI57778.1 lysozyme [Sphingomonas parva]
MRTLRLALLLLLAAALLALVAWRLAIRWHPSERTYPLQGIDVSHHQGAIDWTALPAQGVDFAYLKASEGGDHRDRRFHANRRGAAAAGIPHGAYHFFTLCRGGAAQAANFLAAISADPTLLPPAVDLEFGGNCAARPDRAALLRELAAFLAPVEARTGRRAILYVTEEFEAAYRISEASDRPLWLRRLLRRPAYGTRPWRIWQASSFRALRGIDGRVDWNVVDGACGLAALAAPCPPASSGGHSAS